MKIEILKSKDEIGRYAADLFKEVIKQNNAAILGLATGLSPLETYKFLIEDYKNGEISFKDIKTFNLDEYVNIDKNHNQSYYHFMHENLFKYIDIQEENINIPSGVGDLQKICDDYNDKLSKNKIDIQILGIGSNGHIAFNEPGTSFKEVTHITELAKQTIEDNSRFFASIDEVPTKAISMGLANIMNAKKIVLIATGENKADAINKMINGKKTETLPASILQDHPDVTILVDPLAASKLSK